MSGVDISALKTLEDDGAAYHDARGNPGDAVEILRDHGINWFRLRLFVHPNHKGVVTNDLDYTIALAKRIKRADGKLLLDLHYSDTWADPGHQITPKAWQGLNPDQLADKVQSYTASVMRQMIAAGVGPDAVQVGNEITGGMLWPTGKLWVDGQDPDDTFARLARLLMAGIRGVRRGADQAHMPLIMLHIARGDRWPETKNFFDQLDRCGVKGYDLIGFSYYPRYHGTIAQVRENLNKTAETYSKPIVLVEIGFAYTGGQWEPQHEKFEFPVTPEGQAQYVSALMDVLHGLPDDLGRGAFWWHAAAVPTEHHLAWEGGRLGLFDQDGNILPAADVLGSGHAPADQTTPRR